MHTTQGRKRTYIVKSDAKYDCIGTKFNANAINIKVSYHSENIFAFNFAI